MSFGFGVGDFLAVGKLAWTLYREGFLVARGAPREFRLLVDELKTLHTMMLAFAEEVENADSILIRAGEDRQKMVKNILNGIEETLSGLNDAFRKHRNLGSTSRSGFKRQWDKFKWAVDASDVDELRNKLTYQNGVLSLLLTCAGNSSLQRIENTTKAIDDGIHQLKGFIQQGRKGSLSPNPPVVSVPCNVDDFDSVAFSEQCMLAAEASQPWTAISIADWIKAGRWWLLRASMELLPAEGKISRQAYINLLKASWILIDVITVHPQFSYIETSVRYEVMSLTKAINQEFKRLENLKITIPRIGTIGGDIQIWEGQARGPTLKPDAESKELGTAWKMPDDDILFQRFANFHADRHSEQIFSLILLLNNKKTRCARLVIYDSGWRDLAVYYFTAQTCLFYIPRLEEPNAVHIRRRHITFSEHADSILLYVMILLYTKYASMAHGNDSFTSDITNHYALMLLIAIKESSTDAIKSLLAMEDFLRHDSDPKANPSFIRMAQTVAQTVLCGGMQIEKEAKYSPLVYPPSEQSLLEWMLCTGHQEMVKRFLYEKGLPPPQAGLQESWSLTRLICRQRDDLLFFLLPDTTPSRGFPNECFWIAIRTANEAVINLLLNRGANIEAKIDGQTPLLYATERGHEAIVKLLLDRGAQTQARSDDQLTPLHIAIDKGHEAIVQLLLKHGADIEAKSGDEWTSLHYAARKGHRTLVRLLLDRGANIRAMCKEGLTPLHLAVMKGSNAIVQLLLDHGADIEASSGDGWTPLHYAALEGRRTLVQLLLDRGSNIDAMSKDGQSPLHLAAFNRHEAICKLLLDQGADVDAKCRENAPTPLHHAISAGSEAIVKLLLGHGANVGVTVGEEKLLHKAVEEHHEAIVNLLLDHGADIEAQGGRYARTPLHYTVGKGYVAIAKLLLDRGANVQARNNKDETLLFTAFENPDMYNLLLTYGADINAQQGVDGLTVLQYTIKYENLHRVEFSRLLDSGADIEAKNKMGWTALYYAVDRERSGVIRRLFKHGADLEAKAGEFSQTPLHYATSASVSLRENIINIVHTLLDCGADLEAMDKRGWTPLHYAAESGNMAIVRLLLDRGANLEARNRQKQTPLHCACTVQKGNEDVVRLLLNWGADIEAEDRDGKLRPLHYAARNGNRAIVELLFERGADIQAKGGDGEWTALQYATENGHDDIVKLLSDWAA